MGQYLTTNLNIFFQYSKEGANQRISQTNSGLEIITQPIIGNSRFFNFMEHDEWYTWRLKPEVLKDNLHDLLKRYYLDLYREDTDYIDDCKGILAALQTTKDIKEYAVNNPHECFLYRESWESYYHDQSTHDYFLSCFQLSAEGKVVTEGIEAHLEFFTELIRQKYADNPLSSCFYVNVWG